MHTAGIIAEYNPFHNGHLYHLNETRRLTGADYIIAVMSGDFVQRGTPAIIDKYTRARMALLSGADLVLELPVGISCGSAEYFASGAVKLLDSLGVVDTLSFGSESGSLIPFEETAAILSDEPISYRIHLQELLKSGRSFPKARKEALLSYLSDTRQNTQIYNHFFDTPNNILGIEYCKALSALSSGIRPLTIRRKGEGYHSTSLQTEMGSASAIRALVERDQTADPDTILARQMPETVLDLFMKTISKYGTLHADDFSLLLKYKLMQENAETLTSYLDVSRELSNRIYAKLNDFTDITGFIGLLKTRELTYTRISRCLLHILLNIRAIPNVFYGRILGFRREAQPLLSAIKKEGAIPLLSKAADADKLLDTQAADIFRQDIFAANLYESVAANKQNRSFRHEYTRQLEII